MVEKQGRVNFGFGYLLLLFLCTYLFLFSLQSKMGSCLAAGLVAVLGQVIIWGGRSMLWLARLLGFAAVGVGKGTMAAAAMSYHGAVAAGSVIAQVTSMAMRTAV